MNILVIEDNRDINANLVDFFEAKGHSVSSALDGLTGLHFAQTQQFDAIILDLMIPGVDGHEICRRLREECRSMCAIIIMSARDQLDDRLTGFKLGADDYIIKPCAMAEVLARVQAVVARMLNCSNPLNVLVVGDLFLDLGTLEVYRAGVLIKLNPTCIRLLEIMMRKSPRAASRRELEEGLRSKISSQSDNLRSNIHILRNAIDKNFSSELIHTVKKVGYKVAVN